MFAGNAGNLPDDIDRRHVVRVAIDRAAPDVVTEGTGLEWTPVVTGDGKTMAYISATAQRPPLVTVMPVSGGKATLVGAERLPADFPTAQLVTPRKVVYKSADGMEIHAQLFDAGHGVAGASSGAKRPAIVFVHGGPPRQMQLGWNYSDYYSNAYALNQYLASKGYVVLSVNYRLGLGYGYDFHNAPHSGAQGADEYMDVKAAGEWLRTQPQVDGGKIGIYGGSYGGFLTAMALAHNSDLFAAGVDIHGVHDWTAERVRGLLSDDRYEKAPDAAAALDTAWKSSPVSALKGWKSPVLIIQGDDDRNVRFSQTVDLARRLQARGVPFEELVIPDDTHHMMLWANSVRVDDAIAGYFDRRFAPRAATASGTATRR
jgi:dipeptidyl aminopeptidase/acylaminoacyl peptidase